jgi:hypothetical protein
MSELNIGSEQIITVIQCNVKSNPEEFKKWIKDRASKYVFELKEENTISYEWFLSDNGKKATLVERYINSDATVQRFKNHGASPIASEVVEFVDFEAVYCFGNPKDDLREMLGGWGAIIQNHFCGFNHSL